MRLIENYIARAEQLLNPVDWIPFVASYSGMVRILAGAVQVAASIAFTCLKITHVMLSDWDSFSGALEQGFTYSLHGIGNILRGALAMLPGVNLILFFHDNYLGRMNYPEEILHPGVYPLSSAYKFVEQY